MRCPAAAARRRDSAPPTACAIRPQFGSPPCSAALTSGEFATARATPRDDASSRRRARPRGRSAWSPRRRARCPARACAAPSPAPRRSAASSSVLRLDRPRRARRTPAGSRCRWWRAARRRDTRSNERSTHTPSSRSAVSADSAASVWTKQSIVANAGEIIPAPLACAVSRTVPDGSATSTSTSLANLSVVRIASEKSPCAVLAQLGARAGRCRGSPRRRRAARRSRRSRRPRPGPRARRRAIAAAPCMRAASSKPAVAGGRVGVAGVGDDHADRVEPRARPGVSTTGAASTPERVKRAALTQSGAEQTSRPRSSAAGRLEPAGDARRAEARGQVAGVARSRAPGISSQRELTRSPSVSGRSEHQVQVLHGLRRRALPQVVDRREDDDPARPRVLVPRDPAVVGVAHVDHADRAVAQLDERLARVRVVEQLDQLVLARARATASRSRRRARPGRAAAGAA